MGPNHIMIVDDLLIIISKLLKKEIDISWFEDESNKMNDVFIFFNFIKNNDLLEKLDKVYKTLMDHWDIKILKEIYFLSENEKKILFSIFIIKSLLKNIMITDTSDLRYINSDTSIQIIYEYWSKFLLFYDNNPIINEIENKKIIFKLCKILIELKVLKEIKIKNKNKTILYWSLNISYLILDVRESFNISFDKFEIVLINGEKYLKGSFFNKIFKIFVENIKSHEKFQLKDESYLEKIANMGWYVSYDDLSRVIKIIEKNENLEKSTIEEELNSLNMELCNNSKKIKLIINNINIKFKKKIKSKLSNELKTVNNLENYCMYILNNMCKKILNSKDNLNYCEKLIPILNENYQKIVKKNIKKEKIIFNKIKNIPKFTEEINCLENDMDYSFNKFDLYNNNNNCSSNVNNGYIEYNEHNLNYSDTITEEFKIENELDIRNTKIVNYEETKNINLSTILLLLSKKEIQEIIKKNKRKLINLKQEKFYDNEIKNENTNLFRYIYNKYCLDEYWSMYYKEIKNSTIIIKELNKKLQAKISKILLFYNLVALEKCSIDESRKIFLPFFFDFRGRFYYLSNISPTTLRYARYIYNYGYYDTLPKESEIIKKIVDSNIIYLNKVKNIYDIKTNLNIINEGIFWCMIAMGKIAITKKTQIKTEELLEKAVSLIMYENTFLKDTIDIIEYEHYSSIIASFKEKRIIKKCILKDATASFIQNLIRLMGYKNKKSLEIANLNSTEIWYDTYSFIIEEWKKKDIVKSFNEDYLRFFTRSSIKKTIMTNPYSATYLTAFTYFKESVHEIFKVEIDFCGEEEKIFKHFYNFISNTVEEEYFLANKSNKIIEYIRNILLTKSQIMIETHDSKSNFIYYKLIPKNYDLIINIPGKGIKKRITKRYEKLSLQIDINKIAVSIRANWIHYIDGLLVRDINRELEYPYISIHDCFLIDSLQVSNFIEIANKESNRKIFENAEWNSKNTDEFFSIYIFI